MAESKPFVRVTKLIGGDILIAKDAVLKIEKNISGGAEITLKEIKDGKNVVVTTDSQLSSFELVLSCF